MRRIFAGLALAALLVACGQADQVENAGGPMGGADGYASVTREEAAQEAPAPMAPPPPPPAPTTAPADADVSRGGETGSSVTPTPDQPRGGTNSPILFLAYSYQIGLELPAGVLADTVARHVANCQAAGPRLCQLVGSNVSGDPESSMNGYVSLRAEPNWLRTFRNGLEAEADAAGGKILQEATNSEDLTRAIVDTEARLRAQTALRDRLQRLLESRPGRLSDLLEVERELARVQGEIDAVQSALAVMRTRVSMSELTLSYQSTSRPLRSDTFRPLGEAFANFLGIVVAGFAAIVTIIAGLIPLAVVVVPIVWLVLRWRRRRGGRFFNRDPKPAEPATPPQ
ncbi:hypothetical protein U91I_03219 [alpha proteobacterium U9-1i]|nr:hypothetical protein U91I_03219 [alpha proteobacterium U9-1i]